MMHFCLQQFFIAVLSVCTLCFFGTTDAMGRKRPLVGQPTSQEKVAVTNRAIMPMPAFFGIFRLEAALFHEVSNAIFADSQGFMAELNRQLQQQNLHDLVHVQEIDVSSAQSYAQKHLGEMLDADRLIAQGPSASYAIVGKVTFATTLLMSPSFAAYLQQESTECNRYFLSMLMREETKTKFCAAVQATLIALQQPAGAHEEDDYSDMPPLIADDQE